MLMSRKVSSLSPEITSELACAWVCAAHSCSVCTMSTLLDRRGLMHFTVHISSIWFSADLTVKEKMQPLKGPVKEKKKRFCSFLHLI